MRDLVVPPDPAVAKPALRMSALPGPVGVRRVAVLRVHFGTPGTITAAQIAAEAFTNPDSASAFMAESSFGKVTLTGDVFGWFQVPPVENCDFPAIGRSARDAAAAAGVNLDPYDHIAYYIYPAVAGCNFAATAEGQSVATPGRQSWFMATWDARVVAHEFGHNLGLRHANAYACGSVPLASSGLCTSNVYGDQIDTMGAGRAQFNVYNKAALGWLDVCGVAAAAGRGSFDVVPIETAGSGIHGVRVPADPSLCPTDRDRAPPCYYYIEYRQPIGVFDGGPALAGWPVFDGVLIRLAGAVDLSGEQAATETELLDMTPMRPGDPGPDFQNARLAAGRSYQDPFGVRIAVQAADATRARVAVEVPGTVGLTTCLDGTALPGDPQCANGRRDGDETDVDCGGRCAPCTEGRACTGSLDCWSRLCAGGICRAQVACDDGIKNGSETDVDCGGASGCPRCADGLTCAAAADCRSGRCLNGTCSSAQLSAVIRIYSDWSTGFCGDITMTNTGTTTILDWRLRIQFADSSFTNTWNAVYTRGAASVVDVTPVDWNHAIWPSSIATTGFCATKTGPNYRPRLMTVIAQP